MKSIQIISVSQKGSFFFKDSGSIRESTFQGFMLNTTPSSRHILSKTFSNEFTCTISKTGKIRLNNKDILSHLLSNGVLSIKQEQMKQSKVFSEEEKDSLKEEMMKYLENKKQIDEANKNEIEDLVSDRKLFQKVYPQIKQIVGGIQFLGEDIVIKTVINDKALYLPIKLQNIEHYFQLIEPRLTVRLISSYPEISIKINHPYYNLAKKKYECEAVLPRQFEQQILANGWGTLNLKNLNKMKPQDSLKLRQIEKKARLAHNGIFKKPFEILNLIYTKNNMVGLVQQVLEGYSYKIRNKKGEQFKVELANVYCPVENETGAFECREFARKNLIGREVNIFSKKDEQFNMQATVVRISDNKDIQTLMIENGYGFVKEELLGTMIVSKIEALMKKTKEKKRGIHDDKKLGVQLFEDFTLPYHKKDKLQKKAAIEKKQKYLQDTDEQIDGVIDKIIDPVTYIVRIIQDRKILRVRLDGIAKIEGNPNLTQIKEINKISSVFTYRNFFQRNVSIDLEYFDEIQNTFVGKMSLAGRRSMNSLQEILLGEGLVYIDGVYNENWENIQEQAKKQGKNIWKNNLKVFTKNMLYEEQKQSFKGKLSWVQNGETVFIQPQQIYDKLDHVYDILNKEPLPSISKENLVVGYICGSQFQGEVCRAKILSITEQEVGVVFIDWGNKALVKQNNLFQIPSELQYIPELCCEVKLDLVAPLKLRRLDAEFIEKVREVMMEDQVQIMKGQGRMVNIYTKQNEHMNINLIEEGYLKADLNKIGDEKLMQNMQDLMQKLRLNLVGIWEVYDYSDQEIETQYIY